MVISWTISKTFSIITTSICKFDYLNFLKLSHSFLNNLSFVPMTISPFSLAFNMDMNRQINMCLFMSMIFILIENKFENKINNN